MERSSKRQKLSSNGADLYQQYSSSYTRPSSSLTTPSTLSRTLDLAEFQRPYFLLDPQDASKSYQRRRSLGRVILPRAPDVTVTAGVLEVAVDGGLSTQIAVPTADVAVTLSSLGTLTIPALTTSTTKSDPSETSKSSTTSSSSSGLFTTTTSRTNTTLSSTEKTVTITATSTFRVSYSNGSFVAATSTRHPSQSILSSKTLGIISSIDSTYTESILSSNPDETGTFETVSSTGDLTAAVGATATKSSSHGGSTSTTSSNGGGDGPSAPALTPQQTQMVGGIVGGLAGVALIAFAMLYVLRWYRKRMVNKNGLKKLIDFDPAHDHGSSGLVGAAGPMSSISQSSFSPAAGALIPSSKKWWNGLDTLNPSGPFSPESEKGFQRISGRKIPPVLATGGDQYGDHQPNILSPFDEKVGMAMSTPTSRQRPIYSQQRSFNDSLVYSDFEDPDTYPHNHQFEPSSEPTTPKHGAITIHNGNSDRIRRPPLSHTRSYQDIALEDLGRALSTEVSRPDGFAVIRNSPARTPVTQSPSAGSVIMPFQAPMSMDDDIPDMPPLTPLSPGHPAYGLGLGSDLLARRIPSQVSARSNSSVGRFKEELS